MVAEIVAILWGIVAWYFNGETVARTASPAELTWTVAAFGGVILNGVSLYDARADLYYLRRNRINGARELVARQHRRNAAVRGAIKTVFFVVGLAAMGNPPRPGPVNAASSIAGIGFLVAILALTWLDLVERRERARLVALLMHRRALIDPVIDGVISIDRASKVLSWSPGAERIFGYAAGAIVGEGLGRLMLPEDAERHHAGILRYLATGESHILGRPLNFVGIRADHTPVPLEVTITELSGAGPARFSGIVRQRSTLGL